MVEKMVKAAEGQEKRNCEQEVSEPAETARGEAAEGQEKRKSEPEVSKPVEPEVDEPNQSALFGYSKSESSSANLTSVNILVLFVSWFLLG